MCRRLGGLGDEERKRRDGDDGGLYIEGGWRQPSCFHSPSCCHVRSRLAPSTICILEGKNLNKQLFVLETLLLST